MERSVCGIMQYVQVPDTQVTNATSNVKRKDSDLKAPNIKLPTFPTFLLSLPGIGMSTILGAGGAILDLIDAGIDSEKKRKANRRKKAADARKKASDARKKKAADARKKAADARKKAADARKQQNATRRTNNRTNRQLLNKNNRAKIQAENQQKRAKANAARNAKIKTQIDNLKAKNAKLTSGMSPNFI